MTIIGFPPFQVNPNQCWRRISHRRNSVLVLIERLDDAFSRLRSFHPIPIGMAITTAIAIAIATVIGIGIAIRMVITIGLAGTSMTSLDSFVYRKDKMDVFLSESVAAATVGKVGFSR